MRVFGRCFVLSLDSTFPGNGGDIKEEALLVRTTPLGKQSRTTRHSLLGQRQVNDQ